MFLNAILATLFLFDNQKRTAVYFGSIYRTSLGILDTRNLLNDFSTLTTLLMEPQKHENSHTYENSVPKQKYCARSDSENLSIAITFS